MKARLIKVGQSRGFVPMWLFATIGCRAPLLILSTYSTAQLTQLLAHRFKKKPDLFHNKSDSTQIGYSNPKNASNSLFIYLSFQLFKN